MRQLIQMTLFNIRMSLKDVMGAYIIIVPIVILLILRLFLPSVNTTSMKFAVVTKGPEAVEQELLERLSEAGDITECSSVEEMRKRLDAVGIMEGLYRDPETGAYVSVMEKTTENNKLFSYASRYVRIYAMEKLYPDAGTVTRFSAAVPEELSDKPDVSPVATVGGSIFFIFMIIVSSFLLGTSLVEDKEQGTVLAIRISPADKKDYFLGKSIFPLFVNLVYGAAALFILGLKEADILQVLFVVFAGFGTSMVLGLFIGAVGNNEVEAIGIGKVTSMVMILAILGAALLPDNWHWVVWWSPVYWIFDILEEIFVRTAVWSGVIIKSLISLAVSAVYFIILRKKILKGLS